MRKSYWHMCRHWHVQSTNRHSPAVFDFCEQWWQLPPPWPWMVAQLWSTPPDCCLPQGAGPCEAAWEGSADTLLRTHPQYDQSRDCLVVSERDRRGVVSQVSTQTCELCYTNACLCSPAYLIMYLLTATFISSCCILHILSTFKLQRIRKKNWHLYL